jgi:hypothetical protein
MVDIDWLLEGEVTVNASTQPSTKLCFPNATVQLLGVTSPIAL